MLGQSFLLSIVYLPLTAKAKNKARELIKLKKLTSLEQLLFINKLKYHYLLSSVHSLGIVKFQRNANKITSPIVFPKPLAVIFLDQMQRLFLKPDRTFMPSLFVTLPISVKLMAYMLSC